MDDVTIALQRAVDMIPADDPDSAKILTGFAFLFEDQFQKTDSLECIESAISTMQRAISATREGDLDLAKRLSKVGSFLKDKFLETGKIPDIEQAIVYAQQAFEITTEQLDRSVYLSQVGIYLQEKFGVTDDIADIKKAIAYMEDIIKSYPKDQKFPARVLNSLGSMFGDLFKTTGEVKDIDQAIQHTQAAWNLLSPDDPDFGQFSGDLGSLFGDRFEGTGDKQSLEEAMKYTYKAIEKADEELPSYPIRLSNFGSLLLYQYQRNSRLDDLQKAIEFTEDAVRRLSKHPSHPVFLSNLGSLLGQRYERERKKEDIDTAVNRAREAVSATNKNHPDLARRMNNLGLLLQVQSKAQAAQDKNQLMEAIEVTSNAVNASSEDDPNLPLRWNNLALLYAEKFRISKSISDLDQAIKLGEQSVGRSPKDHPDLTIFLSNLGSFFHDKFLSTGSKEYFQQSAATLERALDQPNGLPLARVSAGYHAAHHLGEEEKWKQAAQVFDRILKLLPEISPPSNSRNDLHDTLRQLSGLGSLASSVYIKAGRLPLETLQSLEQGRGVIAGLMMDFRSDLGALRDKDQEIEARYAELKRQIADIQLVRGPAFQEIPAQDYVARDKRRRQLFLELQSIVRKIRSLPGFETFLLPPSETEILELARDGPLVSFNVSEISSEAFLVTTTGVQVIPLPELDKDSLHEWVDTYASKGLPIRRDATLCIEDEDENDATGAPDVSVSLQKLWKIAVKPVLEHLNLLNQEKQGSRLPHVRWVGGGIMALVPLHAAGYHSLGSSESTLHHVVSSYVPTLRMLQFVRNTPMRATNEPEDRILIVSMPITPGHPHPLNVTQEVEAINEYTKPWASVTLLEHPTKQEVLEGFNNCTIVHFACHGTADPIEPAKSALIVGKEFQQRLTLEDLDVVHYAGANIAYLSACSTAEVKAHDLIDESVHLASAFQLSGFRHVIGTLWGAHDSAAVSVARSFYKYLAQDRDDVGMNVAYALHNAVRDLRDAYPDGNAALKWAPFIHMGS
jgi:tetratricopeptide (TPR) repeat protein